MVKTVSNCDFHDAFFAVEREKQFSYEALNLLFDYLEQQEEETGEPYELDVIALCCEFQESSLDELNTSFGGVFEDLDEAERWLSRRTSVIGQTDDSILYENF